MYLSFILWYVIKTGIAWQKETQERPRVSGRQRKKQKKERVRIMQSPGKNKSTIKLKHTVKTGF